MGIQEYVGSDETVLAQAAVHSDPYAVVFSGRAGEIACTPSRLIYSERKKTIDIPVNEVGSMEFEEPRMPRAYLYTGIAALLFALFGGDISSGLQSFCYVLAPVLLGVGYMYRTSVLKVFTPSRTYEFKSRDGSFPDVVSAFRDRSDDRVSVEA